MLTIRRWWTLDRSWTYWQTYVADGDPGNVPENLTGWIARSQIRERIPDRKGVKKVIANLNATIPVPVNGTVVISHDADFTRALSNRPADELEWDLVLVDNTGKTHIIVPTEPAQIITPATDPEDDSSNDFIPGGGGAVAHTHSLEDTLGSGIESIDVVDSGGTDYLVVEKSGSFYHVALTAGSPP